MACLHPSSIPSRPAVLPLPPPPHPAVFGHFGQNALLSSQTLMGNPKYLVSTKSSYIFNKPAACLSMYDLLVDTRH